MNFAEYATRQEAEKLWHHGIDRYVTVGRKRDSLRAVWDVPRGHRISRWMRPERAENARAQVERSWRVGGSVTGWIFKHAYEPPPHRPLAGPGGQDDE